MDKMRNMRLVIRRDGEVDVPSGATYAATRAANEKANRDCYAYFKADILGDEGDGISRIDWFFRREDFELFGSGRPFTLKDLYRQCSSYGGDDVLYADMTEVHDRGRRDRGVAKVPFYAAEIPAFVRKWMLRMARRVWDHPAFVAADRYQRPEVEIPIPEALREKFIRLYGYGKGQVEVELGDNVESETKRLATFSQDPSFVEKLEHVKSIARNSTRGFHQRAFLYVHAYERDAECYWVAKSPKRHTIMNGGLIFHGKHDAFGSGSAPTFAVTLEPTDGWSIHT